MTDAREPIPPNRVPFGFDGVTAEPGDHIACFYRGERARDGVWLPYLRTGIREGDACVCLVDTTHPDEVRDRVGAEMQDDAVVRHLDVQVAIDSYLDEGRFSAEHMIGFLGSTVRARLEADGPGLVRLTGEMSWVLRRPAGAEEFFDYERSINDFAPKFSQILLCMYDVAQFDAAELVEAVRTHPKVLVGGLLVDNPWYEAPATS